MASETTGTTAFQRMPAPVYRFTITTKADKLKITLEDPKTRKQWTTGFLDEEQFLTNKNKITHATLEGYAQVFKDTLEFLMDRPVFNEGQAVGWGGIGDASKIRRSLYQLRDDDSFTLQLTVKIRVLQSAWTAKYRFQLQPISLERIDFLEARLRDVEEQLVEIKKQQSEAKTQQSGGKTLLRALSLKFRKRNEDGQLVWTLLHSDEFKLTDAIRFLEGGVYVVKLKVDLEAPEDGTAIMLFRSGKRLRSFEFNGSTTEKSVCFLAPFDEDDNLTVTASNELQYLIAELSAERIAE